MIVVSDSSPIISLAAIGKLDLLRDMYGAVVIPGSVHAELAIGRGGPELLTANPWIEVRHVASGEARNAVLADLDAGEAEAIALSLQLRADVLLLDEKRGRAEARRLGLRVVGLLGLLVEAKRLGRLVRVEPVLAALVKTAGFRVSAALRAEILAAADERDG